MWQESRHTNSLTFSQYISHVNKKEQKVSQINGQYVEHFLILII